MNKVVLIGRLGRDPDVRNTPAGLSVANFSLATTEVYYKDSVRQEKVEWHRCTAFNRLAEIVGEYLVKGSQAAIEGRLQTRSWEDKDGAKRYTTEIIVNHLEMLGGGGGGSRLKRESGRRYQKPVQEDLSDYMPPGAGDQDSIPF